MDHGNDALMRSLVALLYLVGLAVCFGKIASRLGRNPVLFGILFFVPIANLIAMGILAFGESEQEDTSVSIPGIRN